MSRNQERIKKLDVDTLSVKGTNLVTALLLASGQSVDLNGETGGIIFDADANTIIYPSADNEITIKINNAIDFILAANLLTASAGSVIATDTISETTAATGVTIDSLLVKDGVAYSPTPVAAVAASGAITIPAFNKAFMITKSSAGAAMTIVDPTATTHDGVILHFIATTAQAHSLDNSAGSGFFSSGGSTKDVATFGGAIGDRLSILAYQAKWYILDSLNITLG